MKNEERPELFRGHVEECLRHLGIALLSRLPKYSRGTREAKRPMADFCGVAVPTVHGWLYDGRMAPIGESLIKLMCYLDILGYKVIELERMPKERRNFLELIAFELLTGERAAELSGYKNKSSLYQVLRGNEGASEDKEQKMWDVWKERKEELDDKKEKARELHRLDAITKARPKADALGRRTPRGRRTAIVNIMEGLLVLLEESSLDELPEGELADLQQTAGGTILRLSAHLSALSSRLILFDQRKGGS